MGLHVEEHGAVLHRRGVGQAHLAHGAHLLGGDLVHELHGLYDAQRLAGGHFVAQKTIYGGSYNLLAHTLPQYGISTTFVDAHNLEEVENAIQDNTKAIYLETLGNPNSDIPDIDAIAEIAHKHGLPLVIDNTFGTPYLIRPIEHGADVVVHSATKFIGGHGTTLGGVIVDSGKFSMGITTSDDWGDHGKLELDETKLEAAFEQYADQIADLFAGTTVDENGNTVKTGIMHKLDDVLTGAVKTTGARKDKGTLVQLAGTKTGTSATDNSIYDQLKSISTLISSLETRYEKQQDRYWKQFSNLETMMGSLNSQTSYIQQLMQF